MLLFYIGFQYTVLENFIKSVLMEFTNSTVVQNFVGHRRREVSKITTEGLHFIV